MMPPAQAVPIAIGVQALGGLFDLRGASRECHWSSLLWLVAGAVIGTPLGAVALSVVPPAVARIVIAAIIAVAVTMLVRGFSLARLPSPLATTIVGLLSGLFNGLAGNAGPASPDLLYVRAIRSNGAPRFTAHVLSHHLYPGAFEHRFGGTDR
jgi:uncharacterized protein